MTSLLPWLASRRPPEEEAVILLDSKGRIVGLDGTTAGFSGIGVKAVKG